MYLKKATRWRRRSSEETFQKVFHYLQEHPCKDCGETDPVVLTFDHVRGKKIANIAAMMAAKYSWKTIEKEIAKCEVRCANCHTRKSAKQFGYRKYYAGLALVGKPLHGK
jgi:hypothetical protein